jgi:hypothetical protein
MCACALGTVHIALNEPYKLRSMGYKHSEPSVILINWAWRSSGLVKQKVALKEKTGNTSKRKI